MRKWYWFLLILFLVAAAMLLLSTYYVGTTESFGSALLVYGTIIVSFIFAALFLQFERWRRRWEQKQGERPQSKVNYFFGIFHINNIANTSTVVTTDKT